MLDESKAIILDTETTGMVEPVVPVEICYLRYPGKEESVADCYHKRFNPGKPIELGAMATHHIIDADVEGEMAASEFLLPEYAEYMIGHNIDYDWKAIGQPDIKRICTLALSRKLWPDNESHTLSAMMFRLFDADKARTMVKNAHSAKADVLMNALLMNAIMEKMPKVKTLERLWEASEKARVPDIMPFGKHKGLKISELPSDYVRWLRNQPDIDPYLLKALAEVH